MSTGELLTIEPQELQFPFELRKQLSCSLRLSNKIDDYVAFKVKTTNPQKYCVRPNIGIVLPRSTCDVIVKMQAQKEAPPDMQCKDKFLFQSVVARPEATRKDIIDADVFNKESGHHVEECKLRVVYVVPPRRPPSPVREGFMASRSSVKFHDSSPKDSCPSVKNILLLDSKGKRVAVKYFSDDWQTNSAKLAFEKSIFTKTLKTNALAEAEIAMFENNIIIYKFIQDLHFFVTGGGDENELVLAAVLQGFCDAVGLLLRGNVDKKEALENLDLILLCIDEIINGGMILESDANTIVGKVAGYSIDAGVPLSKQTLTQALATTREHLTRSLLK